MKNRKIVNIPRDAAYFLALAMDAQGRDSPDRVLEYFNQALAFEPAYADAWNEKANFLDRLDKLEEALHCYDMSLKIDPGNSEVWFNKGLTLRKMGRENESFSCINKGIDLACGE
jgi:tetratricopeptide (TPR) repeat protein